MIDSKKVTIPIAIHFKLSTKQSPKNDEEESYMQRISYSNAIESLMFLMVYTIPDLAFALSIVSNFVSFLGKKH